MRSIDLTLLGSNASSRHVEALRFEPFVVCDIGLYAETGKHFLRIEVHSALKCQNRGARILDSFRARPFHDGDEVKLART